MDKYIITIGILEKELKERTKEYNALCKSMKSAIAKKDEEIDYWKNQERIRTNQLRATEAKVEELWKQIEEINIPNEVMDESTTNPVEDFADGWDWIATTENYKCDNCGEISPEPHKYCPNCKQFMRNYNTV